VTAAGTTQKKEMWWLSAEGKKNAHWNPISVTRSFQPIQTVYKHESNVIIW